ncbi:hypothetical protein VTK56DRAFT_6403 [Thermocarpiscus australiensis]
MQSSRIGEAKCVEPRGREARSRGVRHGCHARCLVFLPNYSNVQRYSVWLKWTLCLFTSFTFCTPSVTLKLRVLRSCSLALHSTCCATSRLLCNGQWKASPSTCYPYNLAPLSHRAQSSLADPVRSGPYMRSIYSTTRCRTCEHLPTSTSIDCPDQANERRDMSGKSSSPFR